ncbi:MAG TPA: peptidase M15 [Maribacter sp.]|nr:peptidase M15 [Maribacter sp.]
MNPKLLTMLDELREVYGHPIKITSSYRSPDHPIEAAKSSPGEHAHGAAVDIVSDSGGKTFRLVKAAIQVGFQRIGISRKKGFIHLGIGYPGAPDKTIWTY